MLALLLAAAAPAPADAVAAERAFAAAAQAEGQWTAFRRYAAVDATMFVPAPVNAQGWLNGRADPPQAVRWSPTASFVACDGATAVNTGEWRGAGKATGFFTTVWRRQADGGWQWLLDHGDDLARPRTPVAMPTIRRADCAHPPAPPPQILYRHAGLATGTGRSADGTVAWQWHIATLPTRTLTVWLWTGASWQAVIDDVALAPK